MEGREAALPRPVAAFDDKKPPLGDAEALAEASRCLYCHDAPCVKACPTAIDIPTFIRKIATRNLEGSAATILRANLLAESCARVCPVEVLCEGSCVYVPWGRPPIAIGRLQRHAIERGASPELLPRAARSGRSVGLVGSGPASLACAGLLATLGHAAVVYERQAAPGGLNTTGVAPYKLPAADALREVEFIRALGVEIRCGVDVGRDVSADELLRRHDAVFLGLGLGADRPLDAPGADGPGVWGAVAWIRALKTGELGDLGALRSAVVIGGGNTAVDVVRELALSGVPEVRLVYRRVEDQLKAYRHEWLAAKQEGVVLVPDAVVSRVRRDGGRVTGIELARARKGAATAEILPPIACELVVVAIGQAGPPAALVASFGVALDAGGHIRADLATGATAHPRVFAAGDAVHGGREVVDAVAAGQRAARAIDLMLRGAEPRGGAPVSERRAV